VSTGNPFWKNLFRKKTLYFAILILWALGLNQIENQWGLTGFSSWQPDSLEGYQTVNHMKLLFEHWRHKYPRGQFLINGLFYQPLLSHWEKNPVTFKNSANSVQQTVLTVDRLKVLAAVSRWIVTVMSLGTITAVFLTTLYLFGDYLSAWLAGFILSTSGLFVFYSSFGHIDVPFTFWYAWAGCFCVLAAKRNLWRFYIPAALCAAYAVCTKEGYAMYLVGLAVVFCILRSVEVYQTTANLRQAIFSFLSFKSAAAAAVLAGLFGLMSGFLGGSEEFIARMKYMSNEPMFDMSRTQLNLLQTSFQFLYASVGWPVLLAWAAGMGYLLFKHRTAFLFAALPLVIFYMLTVMRLHFVASRYFVPACTTIAIITGYTLANWLRAKRVPAGVRYAVVFLICGLTALYSVGLKLEMKQDTRIRAEKWIQDHVDKNAVIGAGMYERYGPRLSYQGYKLLWEWHSEGVKTPKGIMTIFPDYLIMSRIFPTSQTYKDDRKYKEKLYAGQAGYTQAANFNALYFYPSRSIFGIASWPYKRDMPDEGISPDITLFKKSE
jgi:hypothetical protein